MARICACINTYLPQSAECWTSQKQDTSGQVLHFTGWFKTTMCGHMFLEPGWRLQVAFMIQRFTKSIPRSFYIISSPINPVQTSLGHYFFLKLWGRWGLCPSPQWRVGRLCPSPFKRWKDFEILQHTSHIQQAIVSVWHIFQVAWCCNIYIILSPFYVGPAIHTQRITHNFMQFQNQNPENCWFI